MCKYISCMCIWASCVSLVIMSKSRHRTGVREVESHNMVLGIEVGFPGRAASVLPSRLLCHPQPLDVLVNTDNILSIYHSDCKWTPCFNPSYRESHDAFAASVIHHVGKRSSLDSASAFDLFSPSFYNCLPSSFLSRG